MKIKRIKKVTTLSRQWLCKRNTKLELAGIIMSYIDKIDLFDDEYKNELITIRSKLAEQTTHAERLRGALEATPCRCSKAIKNTCPTCGETLVAATPSPYLNSYQWDAIKAGDYYCNTCEDTSIRNGKKHWHDRELETITYQQCGRCDALAEAEAREAGEPTLADQLAAATDAEAGHWIGIIRNLDPENLCDVFDGLGVAENLQQWLAARDARMKALGAAEALEDIAKDSGIDGGKAYFATVVYREFPDRLTTQIGVVEAADIMQRAAQLRKQAEAERLAEGE